jgi:hypothetical protein
MDSISSQETSRIFSTLIAGRSIDRYAALESLSKPERQIDRGLLRAQIIYALSHEFAHKRTEKQDRDPRAMTRRFLLKALARVSDDDQVACEIVRKHLDPAYEPNRWVRHDALAGLVAVNAPDLIELAQEIRRKDIDSWPLMLAVALLAREGDQQALEEIRNKLYDDLWAVSTLRALRTVPIEEVIDQVVDIAGKVGTGECDDDVIYDAVVAIGYIPNAWPQAQKAADVLLTVVKYCRDHGWLVDLWTKALRSLGNLGITRTYPWITEELTNDNPSVIFEAAIALQKVLGVPTAVARIVEAASNTDRTYIEGYASALRWMNRELVVEKLEDMMVSGPVEQQETARILLIELGGLSAFQKVQARKVAIDQYLEQLELAEKRIRFLFESTVLEAQRGFRLAIYMDITVFILGVLLILVSATVAVITGGSFDQWAGVGLTSGGTGILGVLYALVKGPRNQIPKEVDHLMHLKIVFLAYLRQLHQADKAYTRRLLEDQLLTASELEGFSKLVGENMRSAIENLTPGRSTGALSQ